jgi:biopolymer transport protein ExbD
MEMIRVLKMRAGSNQRGPVILDVAADVPLGDVIAVYDTCRAAKFHSINFGASPEEVREGRHR